jgi:rod shape-determining protein MreC
MIRFFQRHKTGITFIAIIILLISSIAAQVPSPEHPSLLAWAIYSVVSPLQQTIAYAIIGAENVWFDYVDLRSVHQENKALRSEVAALKRDNQRLSETLALVGGLQELEAFKKLFDEAEERKSLTAMVIGAGLDDAVHAIQLNRGSIDGVEVNDGVICPSGAVGRVVRVGPTSCLVQLVVDPRFAMAARVQRTRVRGLVHGTGEPTCELRYIRDNDQVEVGDSIVASGLEGIFPAGVLVGEVRMVTPGEPPFRRVEIRPSVEFSSVEWVLIVEQEPRPTETEEEGGL